MNPSKYKIIVKEPNFTYRTNSYEFDDIFIKFIDDRNTRRLLLKTRIVEVVEDE